MFRERPPQLLDLPHYQSLPEDGFDIPWGRFPPVLNVDIQFELKGALPITMAVSDLSPDGLNVQPNADVIDYYLRRGTQFQLISIVMNCAYFEPTDDGSFVGIPYAITLLPASKRGDVDHQDAHLLKYLPLEELPLQNDVYSEFNPFEGSPGLYGPFSVLTEDPKFTDTLGFVIGQYVLATDKPEGEVLMTGPVDASEDFRKRFNRFRAKRYYKPFIDTTPRHVWGLQSPIELYLFQALLHRGLRPLPQVCIYRDRKVYASFHHMLEDDVFRHDSELASTPDFFFPEQKVAVYCDSRQHHRKKKRDGKDSDVSDRVRDLGITPVRVRGHTIVHDLDSAVAEVLAHLPPT